MLASAIEVLFVSALGLNFAAYPYFLKRLARRKKRPFLARHDARFAVVVCVYNEQAYIDEKLRNLVHHLKGLEQHGRIVCVDGGSEDETMKIANRVARAFPAIRIDLLSSPRRGKIPQLNVALEGIGPDEIVVVSDADCLLGSRKPFQRMLEELGSDPELGVLGGWSTPAVGKRMVVERVFWDRENRIRHLESRALSSSCVVGPFYAFRRELLAHYPDDCIADDICVTYAAFARRQKVIYSPYIRVVEHRVAERLWLLVRQKLRKANGYSVELVRALGGWSQLTPDTRFLLGFKAFQLFLMPTINVLMAAHLLATLAAGEFPRRWLVTVSFAFAGVLASLIRKRTRLADLWRFIEYAVILQGVLSVNLVTFWFVAKSSSYEKVDYDRTLESDKKTATGR